MTIPQPTTKIFFLCQKTESLLRIVSQCQLVFTELKPFCRLC